MMSGINEIKLDVMLHLKEHKSKWNLRELENEITLKAIML